VRCLLYRRTYESRIPVQRVSNARPTFAAATTHARCSSTPLLFFAAPERPRARFSSLDVRMHRSNRALRSDHSNPHVAIDFYTAINATRPGGAIVADDTSALFKTVLRMWHLHTARGDIAAPRCAFPMRKQSTGLRSFCAGTRASDGRSLAKDWYREEQRKNNTFRHFSSGGYDWRAAWRYHVSQLKNATEEY
jgi:hypothetical protein